MDRFDLCDLKKVTKSLYAMNMAHKAWANGRPNDLAEILVCCTTFDAEQCLNYPQVEIRPA